ncbi:MAG: TlyA family rRNA (cytidine-2'-O)-methyltransferase [Verrucomicrobiales bacterium]|nr:TlyA family rRNA (cytidine-2'-O)-methyltransferase [Verrucomicrobiales bacterium]
MKQRLDQALVERGHFESREKAKRAIMAGQVEVNGQVARKASDNIKPDDCIELRGSEKYVSRGGLKLEKGLDHFAIDPTGLQALDLGASTGGFTDCLLQRGALRVFAVDVGHGQLDWKLRNDDRVVVMERTNARMLTPASFPDPFQPFPLVVADCSFISLSKIIPAAIDLMLPAARLLALVKPQFEAGKAEADRGQGVITDPAIHQRVLDELRQFVQTTNCHWIGEIESPITGPAGNKEFLALIEKED